MMDLKTKQDHWSIFNITMKNYHISTEEEILDGIGVKTELIQPVKFARIIFFNIYLFLAPKSKATTSS